MADNYLERKMEELRSGRLAVKNRRPGIKPGAKRILIAGGCHGEALEKALEYRKQGHRVAIFDPDAEAGKRLAYSNGIRYHHVDITDIENLKKETLGLLQAWRYVDTIVGNKYLCDLMATVIAEWKESLPLTDKSKIEIVIL